MTANIDDEVDERVTGSLENLPRASGLHMLYSRTAHKLLSAFRSHHRMALLGDASLVTAQPFE
jgi:hypothetical protein